MSRGPVGLSEQEYLTGECHPSGSDKWEVWYQYGISDEIGERDDEIDTQEFFLLVVGDEEVGEEWREEIEQKYEHDNPHGIERCVEILRMLDILFTGDERNYIGAVYKEKAGDTDSENEERFVCLGYVTK